MEVRGIKSFESIIKSFAVPTLCVCVCALLIAFNDTAMAAASRAFSLWLTSVMPALFPFFVCTSLMVSTSGGGNNKPLISNHIVLFITSALSGAPSGAKLTAEMMKTNTNSNYGISAMCALTNIVSPIFIVGTLANSMANMPNLALPLCIGNYGGALIAFVAYTLFLNLSKNTNPQLCVTAAPNTTKFSRALAEAIGSSVISVIRVCGTIIFFMVLCAIVEATGIVDMLLSGASKDDASVIKALFVGMVEMTNGCVLLSKISGIAIPIKCALYCFLTSFGGLCIMTQGMAFCDFKAQKYIFIKLLTALLSGAIAYIAAKILLPESLSVFGVGSEVLSKAYNNAAAALWFAISSALGILVIFLYGRVRNAAKFKNIVSKRGDTL